MSSTAPHQPGLEILGTTVPPGRRADLELRPARLPSGGWMTIPVVVLHGSAPGPTMWISAAIHGDEVCGVEVIRQVLASVDVARLSGTLLAVPVLNVPGFSSGSRYLPDRRDLNRSFPGSARGPLGSRFAHIFMTEVVARCSVGIDLHTGSDHRSNFPQVRADLTQGPTRALAKVFAAPVALHARLRDGSLREAAVRAGATVLVYEAGEAWRLDARAVDVGVSGILRVMAHLDMVAADPDDPVPAPAETRLFWQSRWLRSPMSGMVRVGVELGEAVSPGQLLAVVADANGSSQRTIRARHAGVVVGRSEKAVVFRGDAVVHLALVAAGPEPL